MPVKEMVLAFIGIVPDSGERLMGLKEKEGDRALVMGIGPAEAAAIAMGAGKVKARRPLTHDLIMDLLRRLDIDVRRVVIHDLKDEAFVAVLDLDTLKGVQEIDCRPSDGVAIAVRTSAPIYAGEGVLERAGVDIDELPLTRDPDDDDDDLEWID